MIDYELKVPVTQAVYTKLRSQLGSYFPRSTPLSLLLLHISQWEHAAIGTEAVEWQRRERYTAPVGLLDQVLVNVYRAVRGKDQALTHDGTCAAIIFPDVDKEGIAAILERVYRNICLLQPETVIPPLTRDTDIFLSVASYPLTGATVEDLFHQTEQVAQRLTLRPAITATLRGKSAGEDYLLMKKARQQDEQARQALTNVPFMQLPTELPARLKHLVPYTLAQTLRCAPVGRDHARLTVAMANPKNRDDVRRLAEETGLSIFPVACEVEALNSLLAKKW